MHALVATASVHTTAAACDWLENHPDAISNVTVLTALDGDVSERDAASAANVAQVRLPESNVERLTESGEPGAVIRNVIAARDDIDLVLVGPTRNVPDSTSEPPGSTTRTLTADPPAPVLVVPS